VGEWESGRVGEWESGRVGVVGGENKARTLSWVVWISLIRELRGDTVPR